jgi:hypothetical protein
MPLQIPAGRVSGTREQRIGADPQFRRIEDELGLATFLLHRVIAGDHDLSERLMIGGNAVAEHGVVDPVCQGRQGDCGRESDHDCSFQQMLDFRVQWWGHGVPLYPQARGLPQALKRVIFRDLTARQNVAPFPTPRFPGFLGRREKQVPPLRRRYRSDSGRNDKIVVAVAAAPVGMAELPALVDNSPLLQANYRIRRIRAAARPCGRFRGQVRV